MTRLAAVAVWLVLGFALLSTQPQKLPAIEPQGVAAVRLEAIKRSKPPAIKTEPSQAPLREVLAPPSQTIQAAPSMRAKVLPVRPVPIAVPAVQVPRGASPNLKPGSTSVGEAAAMPSGTGQEPAHRGGGAHGLSASSQAIIKAQACTQIDIKDRPPDCPPNAELKRLLQIARGPKYRPENAEGFSRNELRWRDIPPPCLEDGQKFKMTGLGACVRFGTTPSRVRSPQEICEAKGLGGCAPAPSQAAVNAALKQLKGQ